MLAVLGATWRFRIAYVSMGESFRIISEFRILRQTLKC